MFPSPQRAPPCFENEINPHSAAIIPACNLPYSFYSHSFPSTPVQAFLPPSSSMLCPSTLTHTAPGSRLLHLAKHTILFQSLTAVLLSTGSQTLLWLDYEARRGEGEAVGVSTPVSRVTCFIRIFDHSLQYGSAFFGESLSIKT